MLRKVKSGEMDDLDIYDDLDAFHDQEEKKSKELLNLEAKYAEALKTIESMKMEKKDLRQKVRIMEKNLQSLLDTAKAEIKRKDRLIEELRKEKDDMCFRRKATYSTEQRTAPCIGTKNESREWNKNEDVNDSNIRNVSKKDVLPTNDKELYTQLKSNSSKGKGSPLEQLIGKYVIEDEKQDKNANDIKTAKQNYKKTSDTEKSRQRDRYDAQSKDKAKGRSPSPHYRDKYSGNRHKYAKDKTEKRYDDDHRSNRKHNYERKDRSRSRDRYSKSNRSSRNMDSVNSSVEKYENRKTTDRKEEKYDKNSKSNREGERISSSTKENTQNQKRRYSKEREDCRDTKKFHDAMRSTAKWSNLGNNEDSTENLAVKSHLVTSSKEKVNEKSERYAMDISKRRETAKETIMKSDMSSKKENNHAELQQNINVGGNSTLKDNTDGTSVKKLSNLQEQETLMESKISSANEIVELQQPEIKFDTLKSSNKFLTVENEKIQSYDKHSSEKQNITTDQQSDINKNSSQSDIFSKYNIIPDEVEKISDPITKSSSISPDIDDNCKKNEKLKTNNDDATSNSTENSISSKRISLFYKLFGRSLSNEDINPETTSENVDIIINSSNSSSQTTSPDLYTDVSEAQSRSSAKIFQISPNKVEEPQPTVFYKNVQTFVNNEIEMPKIDAPRIQCSNFDPNKAKFQSNRYINAGNCDTQSFGAQDNFILKNCEKLQKAKEISKNLNCDHKTPQAAVEVEVEKLKELSVTKSPCNAMQGIDAASEDITVEDATNTDQIRAEPSLGVRKFRSISIDDENIQSLMSPEHDLQSVCLVNLSDDELTTMIPSITSNMCSSGNNALSISQTLNNYELKDDKSENFTDLQLTAFEESSNKRKEIEVEQRKDLSTEKASEVIQQTDITSEMTEDDLIMESDDDMDIVAEPEKMMKSEIKSVKNLSSNAKESQSVIVIDNDDYSTDFNLTLSSDEDEKSLAEIQKKIKHQQLKEKIEIIENIRLPTLTELNLRSKNTKSPLKQMEIKKGILKNKELLESQKMNGTEDKLAEKAASIIDISEDSLSEDDRNYTENLKAAVEAVFSDKAFTGIETTNQKSKIVSKLSWNACKERRSLTEHNEKVLDSKARSKPKNVVNEILEENMQEPKTQCRNQEKNQTSPTTSIVTNKILTTRITRSSTRSPLTIPNSVATPKSDRNESLKINAKRKRSSSPSITSTYFNDLAADTRVKGCTPTLNTSAEVRDVLVNGKSSQFLQTTQNLINISPVSATQDKNFDQLDKAMEAIFQSPAKFELTLPLISDQTPCSNSTKLDDTMDKTVYSKQVDTSMASENLNQSHDSSFEAKRLSLGTTQYVYERVSDHVVNLFITRKRAKKCAKLETTAQSSA